MSNSVGPLYEFNFVIAADAVGEVETWLDDLLEKSLQVDGVDAARAFAASNDEQGRAIRCCQFQLRDDNALDSLLDGFFADIDADAAEQFGGRLIVQSRALRVDDAYELPPDERPICLNCGTRLRGQYCGSCGQRSRSRLISIWQLLREAFGDLFELDSRLWKTVIPLLARPGQLTRDYLEGRRARYMPPFRTYLVLSVIFFVVAFFDPREDLSIFFAPETEPVAEEIANPAQAEQDADDDAFFGDCSKASISGDEDFPEWMQERFSDERVRALCEKNNRRGIKNFQAAIVDKIPIALIVLLPLMAVVLKVLYPLSRRYFVEHLLFFIHFHAFFFLILTLELLFTSLLHSLSLGGTGGTLVVVAASFYIPVYLYKAMRRVYGQGHLVTLFKYFILLITYITGASLTLLGAVLITLFSA